jgi:hypothetical protein
MQATNVLVEEDSVTKTAMIAAIAIILFSSVAVLGQEKKLTGFAEIQTTTAKGKTVPQFNLWLQRPITKKVGLFFYGLESRGYSEAYAGLTYAPKSWIEGGLGAGAENPRNFRWGGYIWTGKHGLVNLLILEGKGSGNWYKNTATYAVSKNAQLGVRSQSFKGTGPYGEVSVPSSPVQVWISVLFGPDHSPVTQIGLRWKF